MPTKHIDERTWRKIEKETVKAVISTNKTFKESKMLNLLINIGLNNISKEDYRK